MRASEDSELIRAAKNDPAAFEALYQKYTDEIYNYFWYRTGHDEDLAEDLMQETFVRAFSHIRRFRERGYSYRTYLFRIAHNLLINHHRKPQPIPLESVGDVPLEITDDVESAHDASLLWRAVQQLRPPERDVLYLFYRDGMKIADIARIIGKSENATKILLSRARKKLARHPAIQVIAEFGGKRRMYTKPRFL